MKKRKPHDEEEHADETWLIPYADLLTLLLALFIVLFASSQVDQKKFQQLAKSLNEAFKGGTGLFQDSNIVPLTNEEASNKDNSNYRYKSPDETTTNQKSQQQSDNSQQNKFNQETLDLKNLKKKLDQYISDNGLKSQLETKLDNQRLAITIRDNALFESGSADVKASARKLAVAISDMLSQYPQYSIVVAGHTDDRPIHTAEFPSNWDLSLKRAGNFMKDLLANKKLDPTRFSAVGYGQYHPIASNDTAEGRAANRRVEVQIIRTTQNADDKVINVPSS